MLTRGHALQRLGLGGTASRRDAVQHVYVCNRGGEGGRETPTLKRGWPANWPPKAVIDPSSLRMLMNSRLCRLPVAKSLGSCAGVILTAPVPKFMSTSSASQMMGSRRPSSGCLTCFPWKRWYLSRWQHMLMIAAQARTDASGLKQDNASAPGHPEHERTWFAELAVMAVLLDKTSHKK